MIGLITDFGHGDSYAGVVRAVIRAGSPGAELIDICHEVAPFSIVNAQFMLYASIGYFPMGSVFYVVVDPGVGTGRGILVAEDGRHFYVMPDNGIIGAVRSDALRVYSVDPKRFAGASSTFHGRDILAPCAVRLLNGASPAELGTETKSYERRDFPRYTAGAGQLEGVVAHVDRFGNCITSIPNACLEGAHAGRYEVQAGDCQLTCIHCRTYGELLPGQAGLLEGSAGLLECALPRDSLAHHCSIGIEDRIRICHVER
jgi:S-adenosylmethionine hydrolase